MTAPLPAIVRTFAEEALLLASALAQAETAQFQRSRTPQPRDDTTERSRGEHSDPTGDTVADPRRLALRAQVVAGEMILERATRAMTMIRGRLEHAHARWNGE